MPEQSERNGYNYGYKADLNLWNMLFGENGESRGELVLVPSFANGKSVTLPDGRTTGDASNTVYETIRVKTGTNHKFEVKATFKYDDTPDAFNRIKDEKKLFVALYEQENSGSGDVDGSGNFNFVKGTNITSPSQSSSADLVSDAKISNLDESEKTFTVTFVVTDNKKLTTGDGYSNYNHKDYQILAWTEDNGASSFTGDGVAAATLSDQQDFDKVPQVRSKVYVQKPITVTDGYENRTEKFYENTGSFTASFDYDDRSEFVDSTVKYTIYRVQGGDSALGVCVAGIIDLKNKTVTKVKGNQVYGTVEDVDVAVNNGTLQLSISLNKNEGRTGSTYKVYVWNESNGNPNVFGDGTINYGNRLKDDVLKDYPLSSTKILKIPKVYTSSTTEISQKETTKLFYEGESFTISATFSLEGGQVSGGYQKETINNLLSDGENVGELQIALYKKNPVDVGEQRYQIFALAKSNGNGGLDTSFKVDTIKEEAVIKSNGQKFTVTFTKINGKDSWDDGASYFIYAWTGANHAAMELPDGFGEGTMNSLVEDTDMEQVDRMIPSVKTNMTNVLGTQWQSMITFPSHIVMEDNVVSGDKHIYSKDQYVTLAPIKAQSLELPDPDPGVDVKIKQLAKAGNSFNIRSDNNDNIAVEGYVGSVSNTSGAKKITDTLGNLKFPAGTGTSSSLSFYLKSVDETVTPGGQEYTGNIDFEFSKGASATGN